MNFQPRTHEDLPEFIKRLFAKHKDRLRFGSLTTMAIGIDGRLFFSLSTTGDPPFYQLGELIHEIAHFVEIPESRMRVKNFGLEIFDAQVSERTRTLAYEREVRVVGIQCNVLQHLGASEADIQQLLSRERRNACLITQREVQTEEYNHRISEARRLPQYSCERFASEWLRRIAMCDRDEPLERPIFLEANSHFRKAKKVYESSPSTTEGEFITVGMAKNDKGHRAVAAVLVQDGIVTSMVSKWIEKPLDGSNDYHGFLVALHLARLSGIGKPTIHMRKNIVVSHLLLGMPCRHESLVPMRNLARKAMDSFEDIVVVKHDGADEEALAEGASLDVLLGVAEEPRGYDQRKPFGIEPVPADIDAPDETDYLAKMKSIVVKSPKTQRGPLDVHISRGGETAILQNVSMAFATDVYRRLRDADSLQIRITRHVEERG